MNKGQGQGRLNGCIAAAAICYLIKYELPGLKGIHQNYTYCFKNSGKHQSQSTATCRSVSHNCVMQLLQSYGCIYVASIMVVTAIVCKIQTRVTPLNLITNANEDANADSDANAYSDYDVRGIA